MSNLPVADLSEAAEAAASPEAAEAAVSPEAAEVTASNRKTPSGFQPETTIMKQRITMIPNNKTDRILLPVLLRRQKAELTIVRRKDKITSLPHERAAPLQGASLRNGSMSHRQTKKRGA